MTSDEDSLQRLGAQLGIARKYRESIGEFRARLEHIIRGPRMGTIHNIDEHVTSALNDVTPVHVTEGEAKMVVALHWLCMVRPKTFFARLVWTWKIIKAVWR